MATARPLTVAYFSMEICLEQAIPTYSGGLGVLAGDTLRSAADLRLPVVAVTLAHRKGYFNQHLDAQGGQTEAPADWQPEQRLEAVPQTRHRADRGARRAGARLALRGPRRHRRHRAGLPARHAPAGEQRVRSVR